MWKTAIRADADIVTITSYNEWQEGTQIEPARDRGRQAELRGRVGEDGVAAQRAYLAATAAWAARLRRAADVSRARSRACGDTRPSPDRPGRGRGTPRARARAAARARSGDASAISSRISSSARSWSPASSAASTSGHSPLSRSSSTTPATRGGARSSSRNDETAAGERRRRTPTRRGRRETPSPRGCPARRYVAARPGIGVDVDLRERDGSFARGDLLLEHRRQRATRAAPRGPEVDDDGQLARALDDVAPRRSPP